MYIFNANIVLAHINYIYVYKFNDLTLAKVGVISFRSKSVLLPVSDLIRTNSIN